MLRKSLILGSITLLLVMLFAFTGCEGPVGPAGPAGVKGDDADDGPRGDDYYSSGAAWAGPEVTASDLAAAFKYTNGNIVILKTDVIRVYGEVPAGKILRVLGPKTKVSPGQALTVYGTLDILDEAATLAASGVPGLSGTLKVGRPEAVIQGKGAVILPYIFDGDYTDGLNYSSPEVKDVKFHYPGSTFAIADGEVPIRLSSPNIAKIFEKESVNELTVQDVLDLTTDAIPAHKSLFLKGDENTTEDFRLTGFSRLTVSENAILSVGGVSSVISADTDGIITNNGTIVLRNPGASIIAGNTTFINNGFIESPSTTAIIVAGLMGLDGEGTVKLLPRDNGALVNIEFDANNLVPALRQYLILDPQGTASIVLDLYNPATGRPLSGVSDKKSITLANERAFISVKEDSFGIGATIVNNKGGRIITATAPLDVLEALFNEMGKKGKITATEKLDELQDKAFEIPEGVELTLASSAYETTFESNPAGIGSPYNLNIMGTLILADTGNVSKFELAPGKDVTVKGSLQLGDYGTLVTASGGNVAITGTLNTGSDSTAGLEVVDGTLVLPSRGVSGAGYIKAPFGKVTVDTTPGYGLDDTNGVVGDDFGLAVVDTRKAGDALKSTITLDPSSSHNSTTLTFQAIGKATIDGTVPYGIFWKDEVTTTPSSPAEYVLVPENVEVYDDGLVDHLGHYVAASSTSGLNANEFSLSVEQITMSSGVFEYRLSISDSQNGGTNSGNGIIVEFNSVRFEKNGLIGPVVFPSFYVGVRTNR
jgi:hypothetical protein